MNRRSFFISAGSTAVLAGSGLTLSPKVFSQTASVSGVVPHPSAALASATYASLADTYTTIRSGSSPKASLTASYRLTTAFFMDQQETGRTALDEAYLLSKPEEFLAYQQTSSEKAGLQRSLSAMGLQEVTLPSPDLVSVAQRQSALEKIQRVGLSQFYLQELNAIVEAMPAGGNISMRTESMRPKLKTIVLDHLSCQLIGGGAVIAAYTGNAPGALILGLWYVVSC